MIVTLFRTGKDGRLLYYTLHDRQQSLTSAFALTTAFRSGNGKEREKLHLFDSLAEMDAMIRLTLRKRFKDGYRLLYSFSRDARWAGAEGELAGMAAAGAAAPASEAAKTAAGSKAAAGRKAAQGDSGSSRGSGGLLAKAEASLERRIKLA